MKPMNYLVLLLLLCCSCSGGNQTKAQETKEQPQVAKKGFSLPDIPQMYTEPEQRADFLIRHYWDHFDFTDTTYIHLPQITEQAYADFLDVTHHTTPEAAAEGVRILMTKASTDKTMFDYFISLGDKYLYDPNSPFRNEELYIAMVESMLDSNLLTDAEKARPQYRLNIAKKNRLGTKAANFAYTVASGKQGTLYRVTTEYTIIYINNPGCHACEEIANSMKHSQIINYLLDNERITILGIYPDEDLQEWKKHQGDFPENWINAYDKGTVIRDKELYDLKAIPSLYLLDNNKNVVLKDTTLPAIESFLSGRI